MDMGFGELDGAAMVDVIGALPRAARRVGEPPQRRGKGAAGSGKER
jgi:hypothetical protein